VFERVNFIMKFPKIICSWFFSYKKWNFFPKPYGSREATCTTPVWPRFQPITHTWTLSPPGLLIFYWDAVSLMAVLHPSLAIVATTKGIVDQTVYNGKRNTMHFIHSFMSSRICAISTSIMTDRGTEGRSWTSLELDWYCCPPLEGHNSRC
jgi:hypothetical protein